MACSHFLEFLDLLPILLHGSLHLALPSPCVHLWLTSLPLCWVSHHPALWGPTLNLSLTCNDLVYKWGHILRYKELGLQSMNLVDRSLSIEGASAPHKKNPWWTISKLVYSEEPGRSRQAGFWWCDIFWAAILVQVVKASTYTHSLTPTPRRASYAHKNKATTDYGSL